MKILHLGKFCPPNEGGIEVFICDLLEHLTFRGIKSDLLCFSIESKNDNHKRFKCFSCKTNIKFNSAPISIDYLKKFKEIVNNYDIIHVHCPNPFAEILSLFIPRQKKIIVHWHSDIVKQKLTYFFYKPFQQVFLKRADKIICTSPQYLDASEQLRNFREKVFIVPLGLNIERLYLLNNNDLLLKLLINKLRGKRLVLSVGRFVEYKGFKYLVESAKYLKEDTILMIAGDGHLYRQIEEKIRKENLIGKVILTGKIQNINVLLSNCDVFCLPSISKNEAFGLVLVEALYFGKPLVTTNVPGSGMNYVNKNGETGLVVEPKNPKALAEAICKILSDSELYDKFSRNAKERFKEFDISLIGDKIIKLYQEVLS
ncbi:MAG: glycosyltransferase [Acidobacterium ailaaui]|nr:glycosyltransferase [Pseudacidobacterium ailaaui]